MLQLIHNIQIYVINIFILLLLNKGKEILIQTLKFKTKINLRYSKPNVF